MNKYECACERGQNCTRTSMCAVQSAVEEMEADLKRMTKLNQENGDIAEELQTQLAEKPLPLIDINADGINEHLLKRVDELEAEIRDSWVDADKYDNQQGEIDKLEAQLAAIKNLDVETVTYVDKNTRLRVTRLMVDFEALRTALN